MDEYQYHEAVHIFDPLNEEDLDSLVEDIRKRGLRNPILLYEGKILDGRHRLLACRMSGIEPKFKDVTKEVDDPVAEVISQNQERRHLNQRQRLIAAAKAKEVWASLQKPNQKLSQGRGKKGMANRPDLNGSDKGTARDKAGATFGVSGKAVDRAAKVLKDGDELLVNELQAGNVAVSVAAEVAELPKDVQKKAVAGGKAALRQAAKKVQKKKREQKSFYVSDAFRKWVHWISEGISGILVEYGSYREMVRHPNWDKHSTKEFIMLLEHAHSNIGQALEDLRKWQANSQKPNRK